MYWKNSNVRISLTVMQTQKWTCMHRKLNIPNYTRVQGVKLQIGMFLKKVEEESDANKITYICLTSKFSIIYNSSLY